MSWAVGADGEGRLTLRDRLCRLESELDQLLSIQEKKRNESLKVNADSNTAEGQQQGHKVQRCVRVSASSYPTARARTGTTPGVTNCSADLASGTPLVDISRFLQHINFNISKGTQAITKIANISQQGEGSENKDRHKKCLKENNTNSNNESLNNLRTTGLKKIDEDAIFKELREEKDKRQRAEIQMKNLRDEIKKTQAELQLKADTSVLRLQDELKETVTKLDEAEEKLKQCRQQYQAAEYIWPFKYESICNNLQQEQIKREEAERNVRELQEMLQRQSVKKEDYLTLQKTVSWLKDNNQHMIYLTKKLRREIGDKNGELLTKNKLLEENLNKISQLVSVCGKLRDQLILMKDKVAKGEEIMKQNLIDHQKLTHKLLESQSMTEELRKCQIQEESEKRKLSEYVNKVHSSNEALQTRLDEMSDLMRQQSGLIARQSETIATKEDQLQLAYGTIKVQTQRLQDFDSKVARSLDFEQERTKHTLESELEKIKLELESEKEKLLIKDKILESHQQTISQLKITLAGKEEEINQQKREISESVQKFSLEQNTNEQLLFKLKTLQSRKEELKRRVEELEEEMETQCSYEHAKKLEKIEEQIHKKQKEWDEQKQNIVREKEDSLQSLRSINEILSAKAADYQLELATQKRSVEALTQQLTEKEQNLQDALNKISRLTLEVQESSENLEKTKECYEAKLQKTCETWQQAMQLMQNQWQV